MSLAYRSGTTASTLTSTLTIAKPSGTANGDTLVLGILAFQNASWTSIPTGWTNQGGQFADSTTILWLFTKEAGASEPTSYSFTYSTGAIMDACLLAYSGGSALDSAESGGEAAASAFESPFALTRVDGDIIIGLFATTAGSPGTPAGTTMRETSASLLVAVDSTAGAPGYYNSGGSIVAGTPDWAGWTVTVRPLVPLAPTLTAPGGGASLDLAAGATFSETYNSGGSSGGETSFHLRRRNITTSGAYEYWNITSVAWQGTDVANASSGPTGSSVVFGSGQWTDGDTYAWSMASEDAGGVGPYSHEQTVFASAAPTVSVSAPTGTLTDGNALVMWTASAGAGASLVGGIVAVYTAAQYTAGGFTPFGGGPDVASAYFGEGIVGQLLDVTNANGDTCRAYVIVQQTGGQYSAPAFSSFSVSITNLAQPVLVASSAADSNGFPEVILAAQGADGSPPSGVECEFQRNDELRRGNATGTYTYWDWPRPGGFTDFTWDLTIETDPSPQGFFWAHQFQFLSGSVGYCGLQSGAAEGKIALFSIWNATGAVPAPGGTAGPFSGEGTGYTARIPYPWIAGRTYTLEVAQYAAGAWVALVTDTVTTVQLEIGLIEVPGSWGTLDSSLVFTEMFSAMPDVCLLINEAKAQFTNFTADTGSVSTTGHLNVLGSGTCGNSEITDITGGVQHDMGTSSFPEEVPDPWKDIRQSPVTCQPGEWAVAYDYEALVNQTSAYRVRVKTPDGTQVSDWSAVAMVAMVVDQWDIMDPTLTVNPDGTNTAVKLHRAQTTSSTAAGSVSLGGNSPPTSIEIDRPEQQGVFRPILGANAIVVRGAMQSPEFDLGLAFYGDEDATWQLFDALRNTQVTVLLRGDMPGDRYYAALGASRPIQIMRAADRVQNPTRAIVVHVTPVDVP